MPRLRRIQKAYEARSRLLAINITPAELTAAAGTQVLALGTLPTGARIIGHEVRVTTGLSGGGTSAITVEIGTSADPNLVMTSTDVFTAATAKVNGNDGVDPVGTHSGEAIEVLITADADVDGITVGDIDIEIVLDLPTED